MPFDCTPRDFGGGHDPSPTWGERLMAWTALAAIATGHAMIVLLIALWGALGVGLGLSGDATGALDCAGLALFTALVALPFRVSRHDMRALAAGRWP